jgi:hypothetical protein
MKHLIEDIRAAIIARNWYASLGLALALPDICGHLDGRPPGMKRYVEWFETHAQYRYTSGSEGQPDRQVFLSGADCYALRCAFLHEGDVDLTGQRARDVLTLFEFVTPDGAPLDFAYLHEEGVLLLRVDKFCEEMCEDVESWLTSVASNSDVQTRITALPTIRTIHSGEGFRVGKRSGVFYVTAPPK